MKKSFAKLSNKTKVVFVLFYLILILVIFDCLYTICSAFVFNKKPGVQKCISYNEYNHHDYVPNSSFINYPRNGDTYKPAQVKINNLGIRGPEIKKKEKYRVLFLGDSFIQADEVAFGNTFGELLNADKKSPIQFISHGMSSWSPTTELSWLYHKGILLEPDEVNLFLCINDFGGDTKYRKLAHFYKGIPVVYKIPKKKEQTVFKIIKENSFMFSFFSSMKRLISPEPDKPTLADDIIIYCTIEKENWPDSSREWYKNTIKSMKDMQAFLKKRKIKLNVFLVPMGYSWLDEIPFAKENKQYHKIWDHAISQDKLENLLMRDLQTLGIKFYKLEYVFDKYKKENPKTKLFNDYDGHWNKNGHKVLCNYFEIFYSDKEK